MSSWYRPRPPEPPREENLYDLLEAMVRINLAARELPVVVHG